MPVGAGAGPCATGAAVPNAAIAAASRRLRIGKRLRIDRKQLWIADFGLRIGKRLRIADCGLRIGNVSVVRHDLPLSIHNPQSAIRNDSSPIRNGLSPPTPLPVPIAVPVPMRAVFVVVLVVA